MGCRGCGSQRVSKPNLSNLLTESAAFGASQEGLQVEYIGSRTGGFTQHGETTRPYRFNPPYKATVIIHPADEAFFAGHPEYVLTRGV